jgi:hypothetical protein
MKKLLTIFATIGFTIALRSHAATVTVPNSWAVGHWWVDTGLSLTAGTQVSVTATGTWTPWYVHGNCGPDGFSASTGVQYWGDQFFSTTRNGQGSVPLGALIGYVGTTPPAVGSYSSMSTSDIQNTMAHLLAIGSSATFTVPYSGELFLGMNDDAFSGYDWNDNLGFVTAAVTVVPEPSSLAVLACGLGLLASFVRRHKD